MSHLGREAIAAKIQTKLAKMWGKEHCILPQIDDPAEKK